jgi:hypothetical protein
MRNFKLLRGYGEMKKFTIDLANIDSDMEYHLEQLRRAFSIPRDLMQEILNMPEQTERNNHDEQR